jgi:UDP-N-acetylmuramyl pentapeptide phosphotransferase/UDP-N-acetylglucosamine-1-phosphate transferase
MSSILLAILTIVLVSSFCGTFWLIKFLRSLQIVDKPNDRSNHKIPTVRGGGIAVVASIGIGLILIHYFVHRFSYEIIAVAWATLLLSIVSFLDDIYSLSVKIRLVAQIAIVMLVSFISNGLVFQGHLPFAVDHVIAGFFLICFLNFFNFMDGIDGISGAEAIHISITIFLFSLCSKPYLHDVSYLSLLCLISCLAFLYWNWHPAKIFLGDVGSVPLGLVLGWLLLDLAKQGYWSASLIIPMYYIMDSGFTLVSRILRGEKFWQPHSQHFYQIAVRKGRKHNEVTKIIILCNLILLILSFVSIFFPVSALALAVSTVILFLRHLKMPLVLI